MANSSFLSLQVTLVTGTLIYPVSPRQIPLNVSVVLFPALLLVFHLLHLALSKMAKSCFTCNASDVTLQPTPTDWQTGWHYPGSPSQGSFHHALSKRNQVEVKFKAKSKQCDSGVSVYNRCHTVETYIYTSVSHPHQIVCWTMWADSVLCLTVASVAVILTRKQHLLAPPTLSHYLFSSSHHQDPGSRHGLAGLTMRQAIRAVRHSFCSSRTRRYF